MQVLLNKLTITEIIYTSQNYGVSVCSKESDSYMGFINEAQHQRHLQVLQDESDLADKIVEKLMDCKLRDMLDDDFIVAQIRSIVGMPDLNVWIDYEST